MGALQVDNERRYTYADYLTFDENDHCEIMDGQIYMRAAPSRRHQRMSMNLSLILGNFLSGKPSQVYAAPFTVVLLEHEKPWNGDDWGWNESDSDDSDDPNDPNDPDDSDDSADTEGAEDADDRDDADALTVHVEDPLQSERVLQPDLSVICDIDKLTDKGCVGAPDMVIEITSPSTRKYDYHDKFRMYEDNRVREYWIVDMEKQRVCQWLLEESGIYEVPNVYTFNDKVSVTTLNGCVVDFSAIDLT